jgi:hypothetical protein
MVTMITLGLTAKHAFAGGGNNNNNKKNNFSIGFGVGSNPSVYFNNNPHKNNYVKKVYVTPKTYPVYETCYYPQHRFCWVIPGDTWYTIAQREYGNSSLCHYLASYNHLQFSQQLFVGQQILLPEIHPGGVLRASSAPLPAAFVPVMQPAVTQNVVNPIVNSIPSAPAASIRPVTEEVSIPNLAIGSVILLEGQTLGTEKGIVRLRLAEMALPVEVLEWSNTSAKVRLPQMDLASAMRAEIEVLRADGSLASKSAVQLTGAAPSLAANTTSAGQGN